jgi:hexokinase
MNRGGPTVNFIRRVKNSYIFILTQTNDIHKTETEDIVAFLPEQIKSRKS